MKKRKKVLHFQKKSQNCKINWEKKVKKLLDLWNNPKKQTQKTNQTTNLEATKLWLRCWIWGHPLWLGFLPPRYRCLLVLVVVVLVVVVLVVVVVVQICCDCCSNLLFFVSSCLLSFATLLLVGFLIGVLLLLFLNAPQKKNLKTQDEKKDQSNETWKEQKWKKEAFRQQQQQQTPFWKFKLAATPNTAIKFGNFLKFWQFNQTTWN